MLTDILVAVIISAFFGVGAFLYHIAKEEIDSFKQKFHNYKMLSKAKNVALVPVGVFGLLQAVATTTKNLEAISLLMLTIALIFGSFVVA